MLRRFECWFANAVSLVFWSGKGLCGEQVCGFDSCYAVLNQISCVSVFEKMR